jgi:hypothetical protein
LQPLPEVLKPTPPKFNSFVVKVSLLTVVIPLFYSIHYLYHRHQYHQQLVKYNDFLQRKNFNLELALTLEREKNLVQYPRPHHHEVPKPIPPEFNSFIIKISLLTMVVPFVYSLYCLYQRHQYDQQLARYNDFLETKNFRVEQEIALAQQQEKKLVAQPKPGFGNKTNEQLEEARQHRKIRHDLRKKSLEQRNAPQPVMAPQKPELNTIFLVASSFTIVPPLLYLAYFAYQYLKYRDLSAKYLHKSGLWAKRKPCTEYVHNIDDALKREELEHEALVRRNCHASRT